MAEACFLHLITQKGERDKWMVDSAAISDYYVGLALNPRTVSTLQKNDVSLKGYHHTARLLTDEDYKKYDIIFGMDNYNMILRGENCPIDLGFASVGGIPSASLASSFSEVNS
ncbi:hypothetical protein ACOMHN_032642 [Nucella lapillus]